MESRFGQHTMTATTTVTTVMVVGLSVVPSLIVEEKRTHTLDVLLVSPARYGEILLAKAITGIFYGLCTALVVYSLSAKWFVSLWLLALALFLGIAFAVAVGLLIGLLTDSAGSANLWVGLLLMLLLVPALLGGLISASASASIRAIIHWIPTAAFNQLIIVSQLRVAPTTAWAAPAGRLALAIGLVIALIVWRVWRTAE
jgi:ABC-type Na+ efflux pump permease subunit